MKFPIRCSLVLLGALTFGPLAAAQAPHAEVRLVHAMPGGPVATLIIDGVERGRAESGTTSGAYSALPNDGSELTVMVGDQRVRPDALALAAGVRYDVVVHRGADGATAVVVVAALGTIPPGDDVWLRAVNLLEGVEAVRVTESEDRCTGPALRALDYGRAPIHAAYFYPLRGPLMACADDVVLGAVLPYRPFGEPAYARAREPASIYVAFGTEGPTLVVIDDRP